MQGMHQCVVYLQLALLPPHCTVDDGCACMLVVQLTIVLFHLKATTTTSCARLQLTFVLFCLLVRQSSSGRRMNKTALVGCRCVHVCTRVADR
jgi:hypothetical protein